MVNVQIDKEINTKTQVLVVGMFNESHDYFKNLNPELHQKIADAVKRKKFSLKKDEYLSVHITNSVYEKIVVCCLGFENEVSLENIRRAVYNGIYSSQIDKFSSLTIDLTDILNNKFDEYDLGVALGESILMSTYTFENHISEDKRKTTINNISIHMSKKSSKFSLGLRHGQIIGESTNLTRDLVNEPANIVNPDYLEKICKMIAKKNKTLKVTVLNRSELIKKKMGGILAVSSGGGFDPKLIIIEYKGNPKSKEKYALVGKGITYDSGGLNIKPTGYMEDMKIDMGGAGAVIGTMNAVSNIGIKKNIVGVIPACENMISGSSYRPGDIIRMYNGKSVEVKNTDAEGRLILGDALSYAEKDLKADKIIDLATLTGACMVALGYEASGLMGTDDELNRALKEAGFRSYDRVWELPLFEEYMDQMDNDISDLKSLSSPGNGKYGGAITAGVFLSKFVENAKWAHIDIAGPAYFEKKRFYVPKHATGAGVRLLTYLFLKK
ncbi:leucyl aminopeptidase [Candidatus Woesearchaeota archaeon]|nr:leucyl aminopeptidase [Candidatus Woesearchaeota archaeon]